MITELDWGLWFQWADPLHYKRVQALETICTALQTHNRELERLIIAMNLRAQNDDSSGADL